MNIRSAIVMSLGLAALVAGNLLAAPIGSNDVARAIGKWRYRYGTFGARMGDTVRDVRRVEWKDVAFHVVRFAGGGHVVAPVDTKIRPVMMFSEGEDLDIDENNPVLALVAAEIRQEAAGRTNVEATAKAQVRLLSAAPSSHSEREWEELLGETPDYAYTSSLDDVRVEPLVKTKWSQELVKGGKVKKQEWCYNYYTPNHYPCGCVATALAQVMKYFEWPKGNVAQWTPTTFTTGWTFVDGTALTMTTQGGEFDWANMPDEPDTKSTEAQRQAIGKLTSDVGILVGMSYKSGGSDTYTKLSRYALVRTVLGYSNAALAVWPNAADFRHGPEEDFRRVMISNFNAKRPVLLGIEGHSIVGDGYGYDRNGTLYYHLNFGWAGASDYWYSTPVDSSNPIGGSYTCFSSIVYNIYTNENDGLVILSGRVTDKQSGGAVAGLSVTAYTADGTSVGDATTDERGIYSLLVSPGTYTVAASVESPDRRSLYSGSAQGAALKCVTLDTSDSYRGTTTKPRGELQLGNCADCDIAMETVEYEPEAEVSVGEVAVLTNYTMATVPVTARVVHYGPEATSAKVVVTVSSAGGGVVAAKEFALAGDFDTHVFDTVFEELTAGERYTVTARVVMDGADDCVDDGDFVAAREFDWFDEKATSFSAARWSGDPVEVRDGCLSVSGSEETGTKFTPERKTVRESRIVLGLREIGSVPQELLSNPDGPIAISAITRSNGGAEFVVWGEERWNLTGILVAEDAVNLDVMVDIDILHHRVQYGVGGQTFGPYALPDSLVTVSEMEFRGHLVLSELAGTVTDVSLVRDAVGNEYATFGDAKSAGASGVLSPLWLSTWNLEGGSGMFDVKDPKGLITFTGESVILLSEAQPDGSERKWYAEASAADVAADAERYVKTTVGLGLAKAISTNSVVRIGDYLVANGEMTFSVSVDDVRVAKETVKNLVEVKEKLSDDWGKPSADDISFSEGKVVVTPGKGGESGFARVRIVPDN